MTDWVIPCSSSSWGVAVFSVLRSVLIVVEILNLITLLLVPILCLNVIPAIQICHVDLWWAQNYSVMFLFITFSKDEFKKRPIFVGKTLGFVCPPTPSLYLQLERSETWTPDGASKPTFSGYPVDLCRLRFLWKNNIVSVQNEVSRMWSVPFSMI